MKNKKSLFVLPVLSILTLLSCGGKTPEPSVTLDSITASLPQQSYKIGDSIGKNFFTVTAKYSDNTTKNVLNYTISEFKGENFYKFTEQDLTAKSKTFNVNYKEGSISKDTTVTVNVRELDGTCNESQWKNAFSYLYDTDEKTNYTMVKSLLDFNSIETYKINKLSCEKIDDDQTKYFEIDFHKTKLLCSSTNVEISSKTTNLMQDQIKDIVDVCKVAYSRAKYVSDGNNWGHYEANDITVKEKKYSFKVTIDRNYKISKIEFEDELTLESKTGTYEFKDYDNTKLDEMEASKYVLESEKDSLSKKMLKTFNVTDTNAYYVGLSVKDATDFDVDSNTLVVSLTNSNDKSVIDASNMEVYLDGSKLTNDDYNVVGTGDDLKFKFNAGTIYINANTEMIFCFKNMSSNNGVTFKFDYTSDFDGNMSSEEIKKSLTFLFNSTEEKRKFTCYLEGKEKTNYIIGNGRHTYLHVVESESSTCDEGEINIDEIYYFYQNSSPDYIVQLQTNSDRLMRRFTSYKLDEYKDNPSNLHYDNTTRCMVQNTEVNNNSLKFGASGHLLNYNYITLNQGKVLYNAKFLFKYNEGTIENRPTSFKNLLVAKENESKLEYDSFTMPRGDSIFIKGKFDPNKNVKKMKFWLTKNDSVIDVTEDNIVDLKIATPSHIYSKGFTPIVTIDEGYVTFDVTSANGDETITDFTIGYMAHRLKEKITDLKFNCEIINE